MIGVRLTLFEIQTETFRNRNIQSSPDTCGGERCGGPDRKIRNVMMHRSAVLLRCSGASHDREENMLLLAFRQSMRFSQITALELYGDLK